VALEYSRISNANPGLLTRSRPAATPGATSQFRSTE
jgi:hypothetical protein